MTGREFLFDIGNVILFFDFAIFARRIESKCDYSAEQLLAMIGQPARSLEAESAPAQTFLDNVIEAIGYRDSEQSFIAGWQQIFTPNQDVINYIEELFADGLRLYLLSNTNQFHVDYFMREYSVMKRFRDHVFSHEEGCAKPDARIYRLAIDRFDLDPGRTIYIDDRPENVAAGASAGLISIHYTGQDLKAAVAAI